MKRNKCINIHNVLFAFLGIFLVGTGIAFNTCAALGNDPVGIVYDGVRNTANLSQAQLGTASNIVNFILVIIVFLLDRHQVNIGTFIYIIPYGTAVDVGGCIYKMLIRSASFAAQIIGAALGCLFLYMGIALFIAADIGLDPFTGLVMIIKNKLKKDYAKIKVGFDACLVVLGVILGGKLGWLTIVTACFAGPCIQFLANRISKFIKEGNQHE